LTLADGPVPSSALILSTALLRLLRSFPQGLAHLNRVLQGKIECVESIALALRMCSHPGLILEWLNEIMYNTPRHDRSGCIAGRKYDEGRGSGSRKWYNRKTQYVNIK
jgi:hypothetical protein